MTNITIIYNPDYALGLLTSVKAAAPSVETAHCFITHGDMPNLNTDISEKSGHYVTMAQYSLSTTAYLDIRF